MLDQMRTRFTGLSDEPCSGADLLALSSSEAGSRRSAGVGIVLSPPPPRRLGGGASVPQQLGAVL
jgi:hypothetical protein